MSDLINNRGQAMVGARLSAMMFLQFFVWGAWYVPTSVYMNAHGLGGVIAWAYTVGPIAAIVSPFFLGMIADRFFASQRVLGVLHVLGGLVMLAAPWAAGLAPWVIVERTADGDAMTLHPFILVLLLHMLCYMPTLALSNAVAFRNLVSQEKQFPLVRVFGTIGWIVAGLSVSAMAAEAGPAQYYLAGGAAITLGLYSFSLPHTPPAARGRSVRIGQLLGVDALALLRDRNFAVFLGSSLLICIPLAAYYAYAAMYVSQSGFERTAAWMSLGQASEIVFMVLMPLFFVRLGVKWMLLVGMLAWVVRYGLFAGAAENGIGAMIVLGILLHGICYDFFFVTGFIYTDRKAGPEIRAQAQGLLVLVTQGLGLGIGAQIMGRVVSAYSSGPEGAKVIDWQSMWLVPCAMAAVVAIAFWLLFRDDAEGAGKRAPLRSPTPQEAAETAA
jgi:nucleoside transporter